MKINLNGLKALETYTSQIKNKKDNRDMPKTPGIPQSDRLEISREARELQKYRLELQKRPGIRQELVASLKAGIKEGTYKPSPEKIAEGIIRERLLDEKV